MLKLASSLQLITSPAVLNQVRSTSLARMDGMGLLQEANGVYSDTTRLFQDRLGKEPMVLPGGMALVVCAPAFPYEAPSG